jgi:hypothetical protein
MNSKSDFDEVFSGFISWLVESLPKKRFNINIKSSKYAPGGVKQEVVGFENVIKHYKWVSSWTDNDGATVSSHDWFTSRESLSKLSNWIRLSVDQGDESETLLACKAILKWGGVRGAVRFLESKKELNELGDYLKKIASVISPAGSNCLDGLNGDVVERFDSGMTKIHSLYGDDGSPIYDSRVGAAIAMLFAEYCASNNVIPYWDFPSGAARGSQIRNPFEINAIFKSAPQFYQKVSRWGWARNQLLLGWVINSVLLKTDWFSAEGSLCQRAHAFEASLFMIGYDLRCFEKKIELGMTEEISNCGWVPSGHNISKSVKLLDEFSGTAQWDENSINKLADFIGWIHKTQGLKNNSSCCLKLSTARAYAFPFKDGEFNDVFDMNREQIRVLSQGGINALRLVYDSFCFDWACDERSNVCLVDAYIYGYCSKINLTSQKFNDLMIKLKFAGTKAAANTLRSVGKSAGVFFGLLNHDLLPNDDFFAFFGEEANEISSMIDEALLIE